MCSAWLDAEIAARRGRNLQFLVTVSEWLRALAQVNALADFRTQRRSCTIGPDQGPERMRVRCTIAEKVGNVTIEIDMFQAAVEMQVRASIFGSIDQRDVEFATADRPDHFRVVPSALQLRFPVQWIHMGRASSRMVEYGAPHRHYARPAASASARVIERPQAYPDTGVDTTPNIAAPLGQQGGEQGAGKAGADNGDVVVGIWFQVSWPVLRQASTARTKRSTSAWVL